MITLDSITKKLGYNPLRHEYTTGDGENDNYENPFKNLSDEEIDFIFHAAINDPECWEDASNIGGQNDQLDDPPKMVSRSSGTVRLIWRKAYEENRGNRC